MSVAYADWVQATLFCLLFPAIMNRSAPRITEQQLNDPSVMHPVLPDIVPSKILLLLSFLIPIVIFFVSTPRSAFGAFQPFVLGLLEANGLTMTVTNALKLLVGRPRPHFAAVCISYVEKSLTQCSGGAHAVNEARKSFPSGHSSLSFSAAIYASAYIASAVSLRKSGARATGEPAPTGWKVLVVLFCPFLASLVAVSRIIDYHHNYVDIVAGSIIGAAISAVVVHNRLQDVTLDKNSAEGSIESRSSYEGLPGLPV